MTMKEKQEKIRTKTGPSSHEQKKVIIREDALDIFSKLSYKGLFLPSEPE